MNWAFIALIALVYMALVTAQYVTYNWKQLHGVDRVYFIVIIIFGWCFTTCFINFIIDTWKGGQ